MLQTVRHRLKTVRADSTSQKSYVWVDDVCKGGHLPMPRPFALIDPFISAYTLPCLSYSRAIPRLHSLLYLPYSN